jgi:hypothetical protein
LHRKNNHKDTENAELAQRNQTFRAKPVPVKRIEKLTGLDFGQLRNFDPKKNLESDFGGLEAIEPREAVLEDYKDIQF